MPRKAKRLPGHPGRPDMNQQALSAPTGMAYGEHKQMIDAQRQAPLPAAPTPPKPQMDMGQALAAAQAMPFPGAAIHAQTERPGEPVTAGVPVGAGPGPEVLTRPAGAPTAASLFARLAQETGDSAMAELAALAEAQGA